MRRTALLCLPLTAALLIGHSPSEAHTSVSTTAPTTATAVASGSSTARTVVAHKRKHSSQHKPRHQRGRHGALRASRWRVSPDGAGGRQGDGTKNNGGNNGGNGGGSGTNSFTPDVGVQFHGLWSSYTDRDRAQVLDKLVAMGSTWVRLDVSWAMLQPEAGKIDPDSWGVKNIDKVVRMASSRGLQVLGTLWLTPDWANPPAGERSAPADPGDYGKAFAWAAKHWKGKVDAWEVWNEPNSGDFFVDPNPVTYTRLLCSAYRAVQKTPGQPGAKVVYGGTMHNDIDWIKDTYRAGAKGCFDIMATHPYQSPSDTGPLAGRGTEPWEFAALGEVRDVMRSYNDYRAVWITEFGWSSHTNNGNEPAWALGVTPQQQANYTVEALKALKTRFPFVRKAFIYNDRATVGEGSHLAGYGILTANNQPKPVYNALKTFLN